MLDCGKLRYCPHCDKVVQGVAYADKIVTYLTRQKEPIEGIPNTADLRWSIKGMSDYLNIPIAAAYRARYHLEAWGLIVPHSHRVTTIDGKRVEIYSLTPLGWKWAGWLKDTERGP